MLAKYLLYRPLPDAMAIAEGG